MRISANKIEREKFQSRIGNSYVSVFLKELVTIRDVDWVDLQKYFFVPEPINKIDYLSIKSITADNKQSASIESYSNNLFQ